jgi:Sulfotransferase domain
MLSWPAGPKPFDGVWAPHWYNAVWMSTGFEQRPSAKPVLAGSLEAIAEAALPYYEALLRHRLVSAAAASPVAGAVT